MVEFVSTSQAKAAARVLATSFEHLNTVSVCDSGSVSVVCELSMRATVSDDFLLNPLL